MVLGGQLGLEALPPVDVIACAFSSCVLASSTSSFDFLIFAWMI